MLNRGSDEHLTRSCVWSQSALIGMSRRRLQRDLLLSRQGLLCVCPCVLLLPCPRAGPSVHQTRPHPQQLRRRVKRGSSSRLDIASLPSAPAAWFLSLHPLLLDVKSSQFSSLGGPSPLSWAPGPLSRRETLIESPREAPPPPSDDGRAAVFGELDLPVSRVFVGP